MPHCDYRIDKNIALIRKLKFIVHNNHELSTLNTNCLILIFNFRILQVVPTVGSGGAVAVCGCASADCGADGGGAKCRQKANKKVKNQRIIDKAYKNQ